MAGYDFIVILVTASNAEEADKLAQGLVETKLAACVTQLKGVVSTYVWEEKLQRDEEVLLIIKTRGGLWPNVRRYVRENHSAKVPEIIVLPIVEGDTDYLRWLGANTLFTKPSDEPSLPL